MEKAIVQLSGGDIRAERNRHNPPVTQDDLSQELGWQWRGIIGKIENDEIELSQAEYQRILDAITTIIQRRVKQVTESIQ